MSNKTLFTIHGFLGLNLGLFLFVVCFSGTFATLSSEVDWLLNSSLRVEQKEEPVQWEAMYASLKERHPDGRITGIYKNTYAGQDDYFATVAYVVLPNGQNRKIYLNPYSGSIQGSTSFFNVQRFFRSYHRRFFDGERGIFLVTLSSLFLLLSVLTGFLFYKGWYRNLFKLRLNRGWKTLWSDTHKMTGVWSLLFALLIAVTGLFYFAEVLLSNYNRYDLLLPEEPPPIAEADLAQFGPNPSLLPMDRYIRSAGEAFPGLEVMTLRVPHQPDGYVYLDGKAGNPLLRNRANRVYLHPFTAEVVHVQRASDLNAAELFTDMADPLHFGSFGSLTLKIVWFILGLAISFAILTGTWMWYYRSMKKMDRRTRRTRNAGVSGGQNAFAVLAARYLGRSRGAVISALLVSGYLIYTGAGAIGDMTRSYGPLPADRFEKIETVDVGPWKVDLTCEYPCTVSGGTIRAEFRGNTIPNYRSLSLELVKSGDRIRLPFSGTASRPALRRHDSTVGITHLGLSIEERGGAFHSAEISVSSLAAARSALDARYDRRPRRASPETTPGVYLFIGFFGLCVLFVMGLWTRFLIRITRK